MTFAAAERAYLAAIDPRECEDDECEPDDCRCEDRAREAFEDDQIAREEARREDEP